MYYKLLQHFEEGNARKISTDFLCWLLFDVIKYQGNCVCMHISVPLASLAHVGYLKLPFAIFGLFNRGKFGVKNSYPVDT